MKKRQADRGFIAPCLVKNQDGQAMAEFAMVLPMLALLTFGTIEVALWLQQQSSLNAAAFLASRSAAVVGGDTAKTRGALADYAAASPGWLGRAIDGMKVERGTAGVKLDASADRFTGMINALTSGDVNGFDRLGAAATLPLEYDPKRFENAKTGPKSRFLFDYRVEKTEKALASAAVSGAKTVITTVQTEVKQVIDTIKKYIAAQPKPTPGGGGTGGGTGKKPTPPGGGPKKPGGGGTSPGGGAVITPALPAPPNIGAILALKPSGEAYATRGAVMSNPHDHGKKNSGSVTSLTYLSPAFEAKDIGSPTATTWNAAHVIKGLEEQEKNVGEKGTANLNDTCVALNKYLQVARKTPQLAPAVAAFEKRASAWAKALTKGVDTEYKGREKAERALFVR